MNIRLRFMVVAAAIVILPLCPAFSAQVGQGAQQDISLEGRISQLQLKVQADLKNPDLHFELSKLYEEYGQYDDALFEFRLAVDNGLKGKIVIWNNLGDVNAHTGLVALQAGNYDKAIRNFGAAAKFNPNHYSMYTNIAVSYRHKKEMDKAIEYGKRAIDLNPSRASLYASIGMLYLENKDFRLSILNLNKDMYLDDSSENKKGFFNVAQAYHGLGEYSNAIEALDQLPRDLRKNEMVRTLRDECRTLLKQSR